MVHMNPIMTLHILLPIQRADRAGSLFYLHFYFQKDPQYNLIMNLAIAIRITKFEPFYIHNISVTLTIPWHF